MNIVNDKRGLYNTEDKEDVKYSVDDIFAKADAEMQRQSFSNNQRSLKIRHKIKSFKKRMRISFTVMIVSCVVLLIGIGVYSAYQGISMFRMQVANTLIEQRHKMLSSVDDGSLESVFAHDLFSVITDEDIENMVKQATSFSSIQNLFDKEYLIADGMLPEEKRQQVKEIFDNYEKALTTSNRDNPSIIDEYLQENEVEDTDYIDNFEDKFSVDVTND